MTSPVDSCECENDCGSLPCHAHKCGVCVCVCVRVRVCVDFVATASAYAKILIEELPLPTEMKTLKPLVGKWGHAGGTKYMANGIYFKFCLDDQQLFGGDDSLAQKVGLCELRGLRSFFSFTGRLCFPLLCVIDCE